MKNSMTDRHVIVVDCESLGLGTWHPACEIAFWDLTTGEQRRFLPQIFPYDIDTADKKALRINRYWERGLDQEPQDRSGKELEHLHRLLAGNTLAGSNPAFDAQKLDLAFDRRGWLTNQPWHHRMLDLSNYAAGVLDLPMNELPGLAQVCELLNIAPGNHTAAEDVRATGECFLALQQIRAARAD